MDSKEYKVGDIVVWEGYKNIGQKTKEHMIKAANGRYLYSGRIMEVVPANVVPNIAPYPNLVTRHKTMPVLPRNNVSYIIYSPQLDKDYWPDRLIFGSVEEYNQFSDEDKIALLRQNSIETIRKGIESGELLSITARLREEDGSSLMRKLAEEKGGIRKALIFLLQSYQQELDSKKIKE